MSDSRISSSSPHLRVLWQNEHYPDIIKGGGGARNTRHITAEFRRAGIDVEILARRTPGISCESDVIDGTTVRYYPRAPWSDPLWLIRGPVDALTFRFHIRRYLEDKDFFFCIDPEFVFAMKQLFPATPVICRVEGTRAGDRKSWLTDKSQAALSTRERALARWLLWQDDAVNRLAWQRADALVAKSDLIVAELTDHYGIDARKIHLIPNGVDSEYYGKAVPTDEALVEIGRSSPSERVVCFVGRVSQVKNLRFLLAAFARLQRLTSTILVVVGDGEERLPLEVECRRLGIAERVRFVGNKVDVAPYLACSDIFVLTSLYETIANSLMEAMSAGLPCVALRPDRNTVRTASDVVIKDGETGRLVGHQSPDELASVLDELLANESERRRLGEAGRRLVKENFDWGSCAKRYIDIGCSLASKRSSRRP